jgi:hypothetical protein
MISVGEAAGHRLPHAHHLVVARLTFRRVRRPCLNAHRRPSCTGTCVSGDDGIPQGAGFDLEVGCLPSSPHVDRRIRCRSKSTVIPLRRRLRTMRIIHEGTSLSGSFPLSSWKGDRPRKYWIIIAKDPSTLSEDLEARVLGSRSQRPASPSFHHLGTHHVLHTMHFKQTFQFCVQFPPWQTLKIHRSSTARKFHSHVHL